MGKQAELKALLERLYSIYYHIVPEQFKTYCVLNAKLCEFVLSRKGFAPKLIPCQLWYASAQISLIVGFTGSKSDGKWDGHVVCTIGNWLIDPSTSHLQQVDEKVPIFVLCNRLPNFSAALGKWALNRESTLWWHRPPPGWDTTLPTMPSELIEGLGVQLLERLSYP